MSNYNKLALAQKDFNANEKFFSAYGEPYNNGTGDYFENAAGNEIAQKAGNAGASLPYTFLLTNTSSGTLSNIEIFGAAKALSAQSTYPSGYLTSNITIAYESNANMSYAEFLDWTRTNPFFVAQTFIEDASATVSNTHVTTTYTLKNKNANGVYTENPFPVLIVPGQFQTGMAISNYSFTMNGSTSLLIASMATGVALRIRMFPSITYNPMGVVTGQGQLATTYKNPQLLQ